MLHASIREGQDGYQGHQGAYGACMNHRQRPQVVRDLCMGTDHTCGAHKIGHTALVRHWPQPEKIAELELPKRASAHLLLSPCGGKSTGFNAEN